MNLRSSLAMREGSFYSNLPLIVFGGITAIGILLIVVSKMLFGAYPFVSMLFPIILMLAYWGLTHALKRIQLHDEQTGDNLYYMGFLFTLTSLGVSLYQFTADGSMDEVVRNFGIAITSTIFGIALRILFNQTRRDVQDIERATRHDLATTARMVRSEMDAARREFTEYRRINNQLINEGFDDVMKQTEVASTKMMSTLEQLATDAIKPIEAASELLEKSITQTVTEISNKLGNISSMLDNSMTKIQKTAAKIDEVQLPNEVIKNDLGPLIEQMARVVSDLTSKVEEISRDNRDAVKELTTKIEETRRDQNEVSKTISDTTLQLMGQMKLSVARMDNIIDHSKTTAQTAADAARSTEEAMKASRLSSSAIEDIAKKTSQQIESSDRQNTEVKSLLQRILAAATRTEAPRPSAPPSLAITPAPNPVPEITSPS